MRETGTEIDEKEERREENEGAAEEKQDVKRDKEGHGRKKKR